MRVERLGPIIVPGMDPRIGDNITGPSLIRVPDWVEAPLGRYYLYFGHHKGAFIRLAHADTVTGPWTVHSPGALDLADSLFPTEPPAARSDDPISRAAAAAGSDETRPHIASPDVVVDEEHQRLVLGYHGLLENGGQLSRLASSTDGLHFTAHEPIVAFPYLRMVRHGGWWYGLAMPGLLTRTRDLLGEWERGPRLFDDDMRHAGLWLVGDELRVLWTRVGDAPERIWCSTIDVSGDWAGWRESAPVELLRPEEPWEGADVPVEPSVRGEVLERANQLRDPFVLVDGEDVWLLYVVEGEHGIALARLHDD